MSHEARVQNTSRESSTFHNFSKCIYTAQGIVVCQGNKNTQNNKLPLLLEGFVNTLPNQKDSDCSMLNKKLIDITSGYNCNIETKNNNNECLFTFDCNQKENECNLLNKNLNSAVSNYNCTTNIKNDNGKCNFQFNCK
jgi:hypothetical protein